MRGGPSPASGGRVGRQQRAEFAIGPEAPWIALGLPAPGVARALPGALTVAWTLADPIPGPVNAAMARDTIAAAIIAAAALTTAIAWSRRPVTLA